MHAPTKVSRPGIGVRSLRGLLLVVALLLPAVGCATQPPRQHPEDVRRLMAENQAKHRARFAPLSEVERKSLFDENGPMRYKIGVGDVLQIIGDTDFLVGFGETSKGDVIGTRVKPDGSVYLPELGAVPAAGLTVIGLQDSLREKLRRFKDNPFVSVDVLEYRSQRFYVMGSVPSPGLYPVDGRTTLVEGLGLAGGATPDADVENAYFVRDSKILPISIGDLVLRGDMSRNIYLRHGDLLWVPPYDKTQMAFVLGEVKTPGPVPFIEGEMTLVAALSAAGGIDLDYADENEVRIFRGNWPNPRSFQLSTAEVYAIGNDILLKPGDRVVIGPKGAATAARTLALYSPFLRNLYDATLSIVAIDNLFNR